MAYFKIEKNRNGLVAKLQVYSKDVKTGKRKLITKRIYNDKDLTETKFKKYIEKYAYDFEEDVHEAFLDSTDKIKSKVLTFPQLANEFIENIKNNLSISYYLRAKDVVKKFNQYLEENNLLKEPINSIKVRDIQLYLNFFKEYDILPEGSVRLKKDFPKNVSLRLLEREKILDRCTSYQFRTNRKCISKLKAYQICRFCNLKFEEYFIEVPNKKQYSPETVKGHRRILRAIFNEALRYEWITKNPVCQTKVGAGGSNSSLRSVPKKEVFSIQETKDFLSSLEKIDGDEINKKITLKFMLLTGVRLGEMCGIRWSDIDFSKKVVHIVRARLYHKEFGVYEKVPKTKTSIRDIPLPDSLINDLIKYQKWFRLADSDFDNNLDKYYIAINIYREPISKSKVNAWLKSFEIENGFKKISCHGLRHTYCSLLLSQNVPIQTVSKYLGHSDSTVTLKVYSHFMPDTQEKVVNALNNITQTGS